MREKATVRPKSGVDNLWLCTDTGETERDSSAQNVFTVSDNSLITCKVFIRSWVTAYRDPSSGTKFTYCISEDSPQVNIDRLNKRVCTEIGYDNSPIIRQRHMQMRRYLAKREISDQWLINCVITNKAVNDEVCTVVTNYVGSRHVENEWRSLKKISTSWLTPTENPTELFPRPGGERATQKSFFSDIVDNA